MKIQDFKEFLKVALLKGYYPIMNMHGFRNLKPSEIEEVIDNLPDTSSAKDMDYIEYLNYYKDVLEGFEYYKTQYKLINTALKKYGEELPAHYRYANRFNEEVKENEKINVYKNDDKCYNIEYKDEDLSNLKIDIKKIKTSLKVAEMTHEELANILKISLRSVDRKLNGETEFKAIELLKLMKIFNLQIDDILN